MATSMKSIFQILRSRFLFIFALLFLSTSLGLVPSASANAEENAPIFGPGKRTEGKSDFGPVKILWSIGGEDYDEALVIVIAKGKQVAKKKLTADDSTLVENSVKLGAELLDLEIVFFPPTLHTVGEITANKVVITNNGNFIYETRYQNLVSWRDTGRPLSWYTAAKEK